MYIAIIKSDSIIAGRVVEKTYIAVGNHPMVATNAIQEQLEKERKWTPGQITKLLTRMRVTEMTRQLHGDSFVLWGNPAQ